jgi:hypothetical protein
MRWSISTLICAGGEYLKQKEKIRKSILLPYHKVRSEFSIDVRKNSGLNYPSPFIFSGDGVNDHLKDPKGHSNELELARGFVISGS